MRDDQRAAWEAASDGQSFGYMPDLERMPRQPAELYGETKSPILWQRMVAGGARGRIHTVRGELHRLEIQRDALQRVIDAPTVGSPDKVFLEAMVAERRLALHLASMRPLEEELASLQPEAEQAQAAFEALFREYTMHLEAAEKAKTDKGREQALARAHAMLWPSEFIDQAAA